MVMVQDTMRSVLGKVRDRVVPPLALQARLRNVAREMLDELYDALSEEKVSCVIGGSYAKNTYLPDNPDIDIFIIFPAGSQDISSRVADRIGQMGIERVQGSREYFRIVRDGITCELVPVCGVDGAPENSMDMSPKHAEYVRRHLRIPNEVRILKAFLKAQRIYGAESHIRGFSGYVCELLIIKYGSFERLMREAAFWDDEQEIIDVGEVYGSTAAVLHELDESKHSALIVIDPVQKERNAGSAIGKEAFMLFKQQAELFTTGPSLFFFDERPVDIVKPRLIMEMDASYDDQIRLAKLRAAHDSLLKHLAEFGVRDADFTVDPWVSVFGLVRASLPQEEEVRGPPATLKADADAFRKVHPDAFVRGNRLFASRKRTVTDPVVFVEAFFDDPRFEGIILSRVVVE